MMLNPIHIMTRKQARRDLLEAIMAHQAFGEDTLQFVRHKL
jgi:hypothetical protein